MQGNSKSKIIMIAIGGIVAVSAAIAIFLLGSSAMRGNSAIDDAAVPMQSNEAQGISSSTSSTSDDISDGDNDAQAGADSGDSESGDIESDLYGSVPGARDDGENQRSDGTAQENPGDAPRQTQENFKEDEYLEGIDMAKAEGVASDFIMNYNTFSPKTLSDGTWAASLKEYLAPDLGSAIDSNTLGVIFQNDTQQALGSYKSSQRGVESISKVYGSAVDHNGDMSVVFNYDVYVIGNGYGVIGLNDYPDADGVSKHKMSVSVYLNSSCQVTDYVILSADFVEWIQQPSIGD